MLERTAIARARDDFVRTGRLPSPGVVRPIIATSWARSRSSGVVPDRIQPILDPSRGRRSRLARIAAEHVESIHDVLRTMPGALTVTDDRCFVIGHWAMDEELGAQLSEMGMTVGMSLAESSVGTVGASLAQRTGQTVTVEGPEHFATRIVGGAVSAVIRHPRSGRNIGTVSLSYRLTAATPLAAPWVEEQARLLGQLLHARSARSRALFDEYQELTRYRPGNVACISDDAVVMSSRVASSLPSQSIPILIDHYIRTAAAGTGEVFTIPGDDDEPGVLVRSAPIVTEGVVVGAALRIGKARASSVAVTRSRDGGYLSRLCGSSSRWRLFDESLSATVRGGGDILVSAPAGAGRSAVAGELARAHRTVLISGSLARIDFARWSESVATAAAGQRTIVIDDLHHVVDLLGSQTIEVLRALVGEINATRIIATACREHAGAPDPVSLTGWRRRQLELPGLDERPEDIPELVARLSRDEATGKPVSWSPDAAHAVQRASLPLHMKSLEDVVRAAVRDRRGPVVLLRDLDPAMQARRDHRLLRGIEAAEAQAIEAALRDARGIRRRAAQILGISRTTLYRKMQAYGIDAPSLGAGEP
jgi:sigma-54 dependent transcriptional regulator, acetoin dehydrogenase operon transcriptional activator AcoR